LSHTYLSYSQTPSSQDEGSQHGGQVYQFAQTQNITVTEVLDFSASINPITPEIDWNLLQQQAETELQHYPAEYNTQSKSSLTPLIAERFQVTPESVILSNGISQAIWQFFQQLPNDEQQQTYLFTPIYSEYQTAAKQHSGKLINIRPPVEEWLQGNSGFPENSVVVLVNPSTPEGTFYSPKVIQKLLQTAQRSNAWLLIDESFLPFISLNTALSSRQWLKGYAKLIVLQSLTKYFACPGIRIGAVFSLNPTVRGYLSQVWSLSTLDRLWLTQALQDSKHSQATDKWLQTAKPVFCEALRKRPLVKQLFRSNTNFVLVEFIDEVEKIQAFLAKKNMLIRDLHSFGFNPYFARIAVKSIEDNQKLIKALSQYDEKKHNTLK